MSSTLIPVQTFLRHALRVWEVCERFGVLFCNHSFFALRDEESSGVYNISILFPVSYIYVQPSKILLKCLETLLVLILALCYVCVTQWWWCHYLVVVFGQIMKEGPRSFLAIISKFILSWATQSFGLLPKLKALRSVVGCWIRMHLFLFYVS